MRAEDVRAAAQIMQWAVENAHVEWVPEDGTEIIYGQLTIDPELLKGEIVDVVIKLETNRGFTLRFPIGHAVYKYHNELLTRYDWTKVRLSRIG